MSKVRAFAAHSGVAIGLLFLFFMIPFVEQLFPVAFMLSVRQTLAMGFAVCLFVNYEGVIKSGEKIVPKLMPLINWVHGVLSLMLAKKK